MIKRIDYSKRSGCLYRKTTLFLHLLESLPTRLVLLLVIFSLLPLQARDRPVRRIPKRVIHNEPPANYIRVGETDIYYYRKLGAVYVGSVSIGSLDFVGKFGDYYYSSTYGDYGYVVAMQVGNNTASFMDCLNGGTLDGVSFSAEVEPQGEFARVYYTLTNNNDYAVNISLGVFDDVSVGDNISPDISRMLDSKGNPYGMTMKDNSGAQLCVIFGEGLAGVTGISDFWFGSYYSNTDAYSMSGHYSSNGDSNYMVENAGYDCGIGWCWKDKEIPAHETKTFSYLIGVGDVKLEPGSTFEVTPEDPDGWNESPAGLAGRIEYAVEDSEEWLPLTEMLESGSTFTGEVRALFNPDLTKHTIRFRTVDQVGNTTLLPSIVYPDVAYYTLSGVTELTYTGEPLYQTGVTCELDEAWYALKNYHNNTNAGTATFNIEGVFPYTIGRKTYNFIINPQPLAGALSIEEENFVYNGNNFTPSWQFTHDPYSSLVQNQDYTISWSNNKLPGTATLTITGKGNYTGELTATFVIDKAPLRGELYQVTLPDEDVTYDEQAHGASISKSNGVGDATFNYTTQGQTDFSTQQPVEPGEYDIYLEIADGSLYYGMARTKIGTFTIFQFDTAEWELLQSINNELIQKGWTQPWNLSGGMKSASSLPGLVIKEGHIVGISLQNRGLTGSFPVELLSLPMLQTLDLSGNSLTGNFDDFMVYASSHAGNLSGITSLNISGNQFTGNIAPFANSFPDLVSLDASNNYINEVNPMISPNVTSLNLDRQTIEDIVDLPLSDFTQGLLAEKIPSVLLYNHQQQSYNAPLYLFCSAGNDWSIILAYQNGQVSIPYVSEQNAYKGESGDILEAEVVDSNGYSKGTSLKLSLSFDEGDANFNGSVDILDLQATLNYMFEEYNNRPFNFTAANLWQDEQINVQDAVCMVNLLMEETPVESESAAPMLYVNTDTQYAEANVYCEDGILIINSTKPVAAFDIMIGGSQTITIATALQQQGFTCNYKQTANGLHLIGYSLGGSTLSIGETVLGQLNNVNAIVTYAKLADANADEITSATSNQGTTGINNVLSPDDSSEVYRLRLGNGHFISIDKDGNKILKNENSIKK